MKKFSLFLLTALAAAAFTSCNDSEGDYPNYGQFVSVYPLSDNDFYLKTNSGKTLYPGDKSRIGGYRVGEAKTPAQRALIYYNLLDQKAEGYDYNIQPYVLYDIYTNAAKIVSTTEELDKLANEKTSFGEMELSSDFLTLVLMYPVIDNTKHTFDLIVDDTDPTRKPINEGYLDVQLRHNIGDDSGGRNRQYYVSFDLSALKERLKDKKGLTVSILTQENGVQNTLISFPGNK